MTWFRMAGLVGAAVVAAYGQGTETKRTAASEFPVHATLSDAEIGAEFMVRLVSYGRESFVTDNFLVVEVALFPNKGTERMVKTNEFSLRVNGKKEALFAQPAASVVAYIKYPDWEWQRGGMASAGAGDGSIGVGQPAPVERFPGDPNARRMPRPPQVPDSDTKPPEQDRLSPSDVITKSALPEGPRKTPVSGYLFFPWRGNPAKLKSVELTVMDEKSGPITLRLR